MSTRRHYLRRVIRGIDKTHPRLGNGVAVAMLTAKCGKLLIVVAPRGCGKSRIGLTVADQAPNKMLLDRVSTAGLKGIADELNGFRGLIVVDDIAKSQTGYARVSTMTTLAELIYSHYIVSHLSKMDFDIQDFHGSGIVNMQPVLMRELVVSSEWEASIQDKTIRYYHLYRPMKPNPDAPQVELKWGIDIKTVETIAMNNHHPLSPTLEKIAEPQWGISRLKEHLNDLLRAAAALDNRKKVTDADYELLIDILKPLQIEDLVMDKSGFEEGRELNNARLATLTEYATHGEFSIDDICRDYKLSLSQAYRIMATQSDDWEQVSKSPTRYRPTGALLKKIKAAGIEVAKHGEAKSRELAKREKRHDD